MTRKEYFSPDLTVYGTVASLTLDFEGDDCFNDKGKMDGVADDKCDRRSRIESVDGPASGN